MIGGGEWEGGDAVGGFVLSCIFKEFLKIGGAQREVVLSDQCVRGTMARLGRGAADAEDIKVWIEDDDCIEGVIKNLVKESGLFADMEVSAALVGDVVVDAGEHFGFTKFVKYDPCAAADMPDFACGSDNSKIVSDSGV